MTRGPDRPSWVSRGRVPSLDGLRAIAVIGVLLDHVSTSQGFPGPQWALHVLANGAIGVDLFFVISGFLITLLLLRERERSGAFSLRNFYKRRGLRILPAYVAYLGAVALVGALGTPSPSAVDWFGLLTYTMNWHAAGLPTNWAVALTWTLSIEEQFYVLWPLALLRLGPQLGKRVLVAFILMTPVLRLAVAAISGDTTQLPAQSSLTRMDGIAMGCVMAILASDGTLTRWMPSGRRAAVLGAVAVVVLAVSVRLNALSATYQLVANNTVIALCFAVLVWVVISHPATAVGRVLGSWLPTNIGTLSYSLYLWQGLFLVPGALLVLMGPLAAVQQWPVNLALSVVVSVASYLVIESPFLTMKDRIRGSQPRRMLLVPGSRDRIG